MKIWIVSLFDPTLDDKTRPMRFASLSTVAEDLGHNICFFSNTFRHSTKKNRFENTTEIKKNDSYKTVYIKSFKYRKNISLQRFFSHYIYARNFIRFINLQTEMPDIIVCALPPLLLNYRLVTWVQKNKVKLVVDVIDPWPDVFYRYFPNYLQWISKLLFYPYKLILRFILSKADGIASISHEYLKWAVLNSKYNKQTHVSFPSIDFDNYSKYISRDKSWFNIDKLRIVYAGNLGVSYDIPCILNAAKKLNDQFPGKTEFYVAGLGTYLDLIKEHEIKLSNLKYVGRLDFDELMQLYSKCHLGLAQYVSGATQTITYKLFDYLGSGLPILNSLNSEMKIIIEENKVGLNNEPGNVEQLVENIKFFMSSENLVKYSSNALCFTAQYGDNKKVYKHYVDFLTNLK